MGKAKPVLTAALKKAYLKNPGCCPVCRDTDITGDSIEVDGYSGGKARHDEVTRDIKDTLLRLLNEAESDCIDLSISW